MPSKPLIDLHKAFPEYHLLKKYWMLSLEHLVVYGPDADITNNDVSLTAWCNMSFMAIAMALAEPGDEVLQSSVNIL
ncbi:hypothetical protein JB92DRAFT_2870727, partial [Gautieria morchelliformis]